MKSLIALCMLWLPFSALVQADDAVSVEVVDTTTEQAAPVTEDSQNALSDLCHTYAEDEKISSANLADYLKKCVASMTDLNENMLETLPLFSDTDQVTATASSKEANTPESMVSNEIVTNPNPKAEQLNGD